MVRISFIMEVGDPYSKDFLYNGVQVVRISFILEPGSQSNKDLLYNEGWTSIE